jgi:hypothetical protein
LALLEENSLISEPVAEKSSGENGAAKSTQENASN